MLQIGHTKLAFNSKTEFSIMSKTRTVNQTTVGQYANRSPTRKLHAYAIVERSEWLLRTEIDNPQE